jgi:hypothetical protein
MMTTTTTMMMILALDIVDETSERNGARVCGISADGLDGLEPKG